MKTDKTNNEDRPHAICSPSKLKNLEICPSYLGDDTGPPHPMTVAGTRMHAAMETDDWSLLLDEEEHRLCQMAQDWLDALPDTDERIREPHLTTNHPDVSGYADEIRISASGAYAKVIDFKMGWGWQGEAAESAQGQAYVAAVFLRWPDVKVVTLAFLYPRLAKITEHAYSRQYDLDRLQLRYHRIADRRRELAGKEFSPHHDNCLYCGRKATCGALTKLIVKPMAGGMSIIRDPATASAETIGDCLKAGKIMADLAKQYGDAAKARAFDIRDGGQEIDGWRIGERAGKTTITDVAVVINQAMLRGVTAEEITECSSLSVSKLADKVGDHTDKGITKKEAKELFKNSIRAGVEVPRIRTVTEIKPTGGKQLTS